MNRKKTYKITLDTLKHEFLFKNQKYNLKVQLILIFRQPSNYSYTKEYTNFCGHFLIFSLSIFVYRNGDKRQVLYITKESQLNLNVNSIRQCYRDLL